MTTLERIASTVADRSARGIARAVADLITEGSIAARERMPTTRELADALGVSPGSISDAWRFLVSDGVLETRGRLGTFVLDTESIAPWRQFRGVVGANLPIDLSTGFPDPDQLIDLRPYLRALADGPRYEGYPRHELDPLLAEILAPIMPFAPTVDNTLLATHVIGAMTEVLPAIGGTSTKVMVVDPEFAPYLDLLERFRMEPIPVATDDEGMVFDEFEAAVDAGARAVIMQTRVHNPTGVVTSRRRLAALASLCAQRDVWILDGDFYGDMLESERLSAAEWAPDQTVYFRGFSKDIHPDIRVAAIVGTPRLIKAVQRRRVGGFEVSRINQDLLRLLVADPARQEHTTRMRREFGRRQRIFVQVLAHRGIVVRPNGGYNVWVPVRSETDTLVYLAARGISVAPGSAFAVRGGTPHVRVSTVSITGEVELVAEEVARAAVAGRHKR